MGSVIWGARPWTEWKGAQACCINWPRSSLPSWSHQWWTTTWNHEPITPSFLKLLLSGYLIEAIGNGTKTDPREQAYSAMEASMQLVHRDGGQRQDKNISASILGVLTAIQTSGRRKRWSYAFKICFKNVLNFMCVNACLHVDMCTCRYADLWSLWIWVRNHVVLRTNPVSSARAKSTLNLLSHFSSPQVKLELELRKRVRLAHKEEL